MVQPRPAASSLANQLAVLHQLKMDACLRNEAMCIPQTKKASYT